jgi:hypothetical protein
MTIGKTRNYNLLMCVVSIILSTSYLLAHGGHPEHTHNNIAAAFHDGLYFSEKFHLPGYTPEELGKLEYPSIAIDGNNNLYIVYNFTLEEHKEAVFLNSFNTADIGFETPGGNLRGDRYLSIIDQPEWGSPLQVSSTSGVEYSPRIAITQEDTVWIVWSARRNGEWNIYARTYYEGSLGDEIQLTSDQGYNFRPVILAASDNRVWVAWERGTSEKDIAIVARYYRDGSWSDEIDIETRPGYAYRPVMVEAPDGTVWIAWDYTHGYTTNVYLNCFKNGQLQNPIQVSHHPAIDSKAALTWYGDKLWIAWTTNRRDADGWGIIRYPMVRAFDGERWYEPKTAMPAVVFESRSETQSYEFPTLTFDTYGRMYLFNRHDHVFSGIYYDGDVWTDHGFLDEAGWGLRGLYVHIAWESDTELWMARRDRTSIFLQKIIRTDPQKQEPEIEPYNPVSYSDTLRGIAEESFRGPTRHGNYQVYYGDIHTHTAYSDGSGSFDELFNLYKNVYRVDFLAITEHDAMGGGSNHFSPGAWAYLKALNEIYNQPGEFVTINAYEWTHSTWMGRQDSTVRVGHKNVYFKGGEESPLFSHRGEKAYDVESLFNLLHEHDAIAFPHHPPWGGMTWEDHDPDVQTNYEIISIHGANEYMGNLPIPHRGGMPGSFAQDGLAKGKIIGFVGGSDSHGLYYHSHDGWREDPYKGGLTGVLLDGPLTRENIWYALKNRRNYATAGEKYFLDFSVNGYPMGSRITVHEPPVISFEARSLNILYAYIIRNNEELFITGSIGAGRFGYHGIEDDTVPPGENYYYLRVVYKDGTVAWSSPIWVTYVPEP